MKAYFTHRMSLTLNWWQWKPYKLTHVALGLALGALFAEFVRPWMTVLWLLVAVLVLSMLAVTWRSLEYRTLVG